MSLTEILKRSVEYNSWNVTHALQHMQVQVAAWPRCRSTLEREWLCHFCSTPCTKT